MMLDDLIKQKAIETVIIRDWRFRKQLERTASGAGRMEIDDDGMDFMRIDFFPDRRTNLTFVNQSI